MPGVLPTHDFPYGVPWPLKLISAGMAITGISGVLLSALGWVYALGAFVVFLGLGWLQSRLISGYEPEGIAIPIYRPLLVVRFPHGMPILIRLLRYGFFVVVAVMFVFGLAPIADKTAQNGIIACVLCLVVVAFLYIVLENHYVKAGRAIEVDIRQGAKN